MAARRQSHGARRCETDAAFSLRRRLWLRSEDGIDGILGRRRKCVVCRGRAAACSPILTLAIDGILGRRGKCVVRRGWAAACSPCVLGLVEVRKYAGGGPLQNISAAIYGGFASSCIAAGKMSMPQALIMDASSQPREPPAVRPMLEADAPEICRIWLVHSDHPAACAPAIRDLVFCWFAP